MIGIPNTERITNANPNTTIRKDGHKSNHLLNEGFRSDILDSSPDRFIGITYGKQQACRFKTQKARSHPRNIPITQKAKPEIRDFY